MKGKKEASPFSRSLIQFGAILAVGVAVVDIPWPRVEIFGFSFVLGLAVFFACMLLMVLGFVLGIVEGVAAQKAARAKASQPEPQAAEAAEAAAAVTSPSSPVGEVVQPRTQA